MEFRKLIYNGIQYDNYEISNTGIIRNSNTGYVLKQQVSKTWYYNVVIKPEGRYGKSICIKMHRAVGFTFIPNPENKPFINHIDCNKLN